MIHLSVGLTALTISSSACDTSSSIERKAGAGGASRVHTVFMHDYAFLPQNLVISAGDTVIFKNLDMMQHSAIGAGWSTGDLGTDMSARVVMNHAGEYRYHCGPHPGMLGRVVVR